MSLILQGSTSGSITLQEPAVSGSTVLDLPATSGTILTTASSGQSIPKAALPTGSVLQVVSTVKTDTFTTTSTSYVDVTGLSVSITPTSATSKILVFYKVSYGHTAASSTGVRMQLVRGSTAIFVGDAASVRTLATSFGSTNGSDDFGADLNGIFLDSPATTSSTTYKIQFSTRSSTGVINRNGNDSDSPANPRSVSSITVMEIAA